MQMDYLYPGNGLPLRKVAASTGNVTPAGNTIADSPANYVIPSGGYTEGIPAHDCVELTFSMITGASSVLTADIEMSPTADFAASEVYDTVTFTSRIANWSPNQRLAGFFRVHNNSGQTMSVYAQKRIG